MYAGDSPVNRASFSAMADRSASVSVWPRLSACMYSPKANVRASSTTCLIVFFWRSAGSFWWYQAVAAKVWICTAQAMSSGA